MSEDTRSAEGDESEALGSGSYEVLFSRLSSQASTLVERAGALNTRRKESFGATELAILGNTRVRTENNCVPRDIVEVSGKLLFGYNVVVHLKAPTLSDVFSLHALSETEGRLELEGSTDGASLLSDPQLARDFDELYKYYRAARLIQLRRTETGYLLAVFQIGEQREDVRVFHWSVAPNGTVQYRGPRGERHHVFPPSHDFEWKVITRDDHVGGRHPHVNIDNTIFVETVRGDLTIKVEDNTETGEGVYSEPVDDPDQSLDDASFAWAKAGPLYLLRVTPYREPKTRYLVFNSRTQAVLRIDALGEACLRLPEDQGIIFPGGYVLETGESKLFDGDDEGLELKRAIQAPNGEDVLYVFHRRRDGHYKLLPYNLIEKKVQNPIVCHGYSLFADGRMVIFRAASAEPTRVHPMQVWQTPFTSAEYEQQKPVGQGWLAKIGNRDLVRGISDALSAARLATPDVASRAGFEALIAQVTRTLDAYYWLGEQDAGNLSELLHGIRDTGELIIDEFEKVEAIRARAKEAMREAERAQEAVLRELRPHEWDDVSHFMRALTELRKQRGHLITLRELRYVDLARIDAMELAATEAFSETSAATITFLLGDAALAPLVTRLEALHDRIGTLEKGSEIKAVGKDVDEVGQGLDVLSEVVAGLEVDDTTVRTKILEQIGVVYAQLNRVRAALAVARKTVLTREGRAEFGAQFLLFGQSVQGALGIASTPDACDEQLSRLITQLEELEARFGELDEFVEDLAKKREEVYEAFGAKKQVLSDERQRRAASLTSAAERILEGIGRRARTFEDDDALNAWFATDAMVQKLRDIVSRLTELGDTVHAEEIAARLKTARQDALRGMRDRRDLFEEGGDVIRLGKHRFGVNTQALELTVVPREGTMSFHLTGTDYFEAVDDAEFQGTREFWEQPLSSESKEVYRAEYLAAVTLFFAERGERGLSLAKLSEAARTGGLLALVREVASDRYDEGYDRGVHDADAATILERLLAQLSTAGLLRFPPRPRAFACVFFAYRDDREQRGRLERLGASLGRLRRTFGATDAETALHDELGRALREFLSAHQLVATDAEVQLSARYLGEELMRERLRFTVSAEASELASALLADLERRGERSLFLEEVHADAIPLTDRIGLARSWLEAFLRRGGDVLGGPNEARRQELRPSLDEASAFLVTDGRIDRETSAALAAAEVPGLLGLHDRIEQGILPLRLDEFLARLDAFAHQRVPRYRAYRKLRHELIERERARLRISEFTARILTSFVRNQLIDEVYLPLIGENLAKQVGATGADARTDRMGLLLLVSPPGYGKTTLMEYVASQLGLVFMKINGPSLGHQVTSLDPAEAPNATARQEVEKINLAFEMGNNVMLYLDDIQHTNPELLQKFISLCDAQRKIEGVHRGRTRTYDMRGKRFCVVMAGNPYTESGESFRIPDMLANRADTYNLGDILEGKQAAFDLSYLENALTSNPVLNVVAARSLSDVRRFIKMAKGGSVASSEFDQTYSAAESQEIVAVLERLFKAQRVLSMVNAEYIRSASMDDAYRTEPPFKLQGSYRNMNRLAQRIVAAMNDDELERLVDDHYAGESQTLTTGAEQNLLKLKEMRGRLSDEEALRWNEIKREYLRRRHMGGHDDDPVTRITSTLGSVTKQLESIESAIQRATERLQPPP